MKKLLAVAMLLLASVSSFAQFSPGQLVTAAALNNQFSLYMPIAGGTLTGALTVPTLTTAYAAITGGTIQGTPISGSTGAFTTLNSSGLATLNGLTVTNAPTFSTPVPIASGGTGGATQSAALTNLLGSSTVPITNGGTGATSITAPGGAFDTLCASTVGQFWTRLTGGWGCTSLGYVNPMWWGAVSNCPNGSGVCTDNLSSFNSAISAAQSNHLDIIIPTGDFYLSGGISILNTSDSSYANFRPSIVGGTVGSGRGVHLYFGPGNFNGITIAGTNGQNTSAISMQMISGISVSKSDYQGNGFVIENMSHVYMLNDYAQQFNVGFYFQDVQESLFENLVGQFNNYAGLNAVKGTFTPPNALVFKGCSFAANGHYGVNIDNPAAVSFDGGSIEQNGFNGGGDNWGIRAIFSTNNDVEGNIAMTVQNVYFERNSGVADIILNNGESSPNVPTAMLLSGNNFNRGYNSLGAPASISIASPAVITFNNHGFVAGQPVIFSTTGTLPTGITAGTTYYVLASGLTTNTFQISATAGGTPIATSGTQSGTQTVYSHTMNVVLLNTANGNTVALTMVGNGMGGLARPGAIGPTYVPSATTPYVSVLTPTDPITICDINNFYADSVEKNSYLGGCTFTGAVKAGSLAVTGGNITATGTGTMPLYGTTGTAINAPHKVIGSVALSSGSATVTLSGASVFTSSSSYTCTANDTTAANAVKVGQTSGTSITFTGTGTDTVQFACTGN